MFHVRNSCKSDIEKETDGSDMRGDVMLTGFVGLIVSRTVVLLY